MGRRAPSGKSRKTDDDVTSRAGVPPTGRLKSWPAKIAGTGAQRRINGNHTRDRDRVPRKLAIMRVAAAPSNLRRDMVGSG